MSLPPPPPRRRPPSPAPSPPPPDLAARGARRAESSTSERRRPPLLIVAAVVVVALALVGVGVVVLGGGGKDEPQLDASTSVELTLGDLTVETVNSFNSGAEFPTEASDAALAVLESYVQEATVVPLRKGKANGTTLAELFDEPAVARLAGTDRGLLLDEGLPKAVGKVTVKSPPVALTALMDRDGKVVLVTATVDLDIKAQARHGVMTVKRTGTLVLRPQLDASWKITAWTLHVERGGPGVAASPTDPTTTTVAT